MSDLRPTTHKITFMGQEYNALLSLSILERMIDEFGSSEGFLAALGVRGAEKKVSPIKATSAIIRLLWAMADEDMQRNGCIAGDYDDIRRNLTLAQAMEIVAANRDTLVDIITDGLPRVPDEGGAKNA